MNAAHWAGPAGLIARVALELLLRSRSRHSRGLDAVPNDSGSTVILLAASIAGIIVSIAPTAGPHGLPRRSDQLFSRS
jgi:hypothetical protein